MKKRVDYCKGCGKPVDGQWYPQIENTKQTGCAREDKER